MDKRIYYHGAGAWGIKLELRRGIHVARLYNTYSCPREVYQINVKAPIYYKLIIGAVAVSHAW